ncbi:MAG: DUF3089 domain-containing protein [Novosphingobium sp.]
MARKFLYIIAALIVVVFVGRIALTFYGTDLARVALVPSRGFEGAPPLPANAYDDPKLWYSRPGVADDPAHFRPTGLANDTAQGQAAVFFVHPTSYFERGHWNAPLDDAGSQATARQMLRGMASAFGNFPAIWAPRYRQATFGAFLSDKPEARAALDLAYRDVAQAFAAFVAANPDRPIILAGHSQGAFLLKRLMMDQVAGKPLARRVVAAYLVGWPISLEHDLPRLGLPACAAKGQSGCVVSWLSYAQPADTHDTLAGYARFSALDGKSPGNSPFLCSNPLTGGVGGSAPASANPGTLVPDADAASGKLVAAMVPARCDASGFLLIGPPPELGPYVLPGNNFHVYDFPLFWSAVRVDALARDAAWQAAK